MLYAVAFIYMLIFYALNLVTVAGRFLNIVFHNERQWPGLVVSAVLPN